MSNLYHLLIFVADMLIWAGYKYSVSFHFIMHELVTIWIVSSGRRKAVTKV